MARDQERVTYIRFGFNSDNLYVAIKPNRHKEIESIHKYARLCEEALRFEYPNAEVVVVWDGIAEGVLPATMETLVFVSHNFEEDEDYEEVEIVESLCEAIYRQFGWLVEERSVLVAESQVFCDLPPSAVRWACMNGLISGANRHTGLWNVLIDSLTQFRDECIHLINDEMSIVTTRKNIRVVTWEDMKDTPIIELMENAELLIPTRDGFDMEHFGPNASYLRILQSGSEVSLIAQHFVDVESWSSSQWSYDAYARTLVAQAKRLGIEGDLEMASQAICGVTLSFQELISKEDHLNDFVARKLKAIAEVIEFTELSLAGGPIWDEIYDKNEDRFCREVLERLLQQMGFQSIRYTHGNRREHGRDFVFAYQTPFREPIYFGLQAKRGSISGGANSKIRGILDQVYTAFTVPAAYEPSNTRSETYISCMIVAISGEFTDDALEKIQASLPQYRFPIGSVFFWDKPKILNLISLHWGRRNA